MVEITPVDESCFINTTIDAGSENGLNNKNISPLQEVLQWPNTIKRRVKRITVNMLFVITWHGKLSFKTKKKKRLLNWKERRQEKKERENNTADKSSVEKGCDKWEDL